MRIFLLVAAIAAVTKAQTDCSRGACYPPSNDLLIGRVQQLQSSSTCGLVGSEVYCTPYQQRRMKCCPCDSRNPNGQLAHTIKEVLSTSGTDRWWQSRKEMYPVTLQLDLGNLFQLNNLALSFKGPRPSDFVIERTEDNGTTWQPALYLATDCQKAFPGILKTTPLRLDEPYCYTLPPTNSNPYQDHTIHFSPLHQYTYVSAPNSQKIEKLSGLTGLRVRMTGLGDVPRHPGRSLSRFFAIKEMRVMGSCMCHGHANQCLPDVNNNVPPNKVSPQCDCQHKTAGKNCERCADLYNDLPWRPAEEGNTHTCQRCECNNHAQRCHFDQAVYEASGRRSGGVCEGCMHQTTGPKCDQCAPGYQPNPHSRMDRPDACIRCICNSEGTANGGRCDDSTGSCQCKVNVEGTRCDRCKKGYYGLSNSNPLGCSKCSCSPDGSLTDVCDEVTGQCLCRPHFHGKTCEMCSDGYWKPFLSERCERCDCDPTRSYGATCDQVTGQCHCRPNFGGRTCRECPDNMYGDPLLGCQPCRCDTAGTLQEGCNKQTGACLCQPGITGARCDSCRRGHCDSFPACETCPSCFFTLDAQRQNLSLVLERLSSNFPSRPGGASNAGNIGPRIHALEASLNLIRDSISLLPSPTQQVKDTLAHLDKLRYQMDKIKSNLSPLAQTPALDSELGKLGALLDQLTFEYKAKKEAMTNSIGPDSTGAFSGIKTAYNESNDAVKKVRASGNSVNKSADTRKLTSDLHNTVQPANTRTLDKLNQSMASWPDLTPVAKQVCGSARSEPCTPLSCERGELCLPEGTPACKKDEKCVGALPLSKRAHADVKDMKDRLDKITKKITDAAEKLQETQETTNQVRQSAEKLSNKMKQARDELEEDLKGTRDVVKELKDFLSDPLSNLTHIQEVSDWVLKAKLPLSLAALKRKLEELKNLAASLPDSIEVLNEAAPQLDTARKLLQEAQDSRETALGVKADVDGLLSGFNSVEGSVSELEDKLQDSKDLINNLNNHLTKANDKMNQAERALDDTAEMVKPTKPQLDKLKELLQIGDRQAQDAKDSANDSAEEATSASKDLLSLEKQLDNLKAKVAASRASGEAGPVTDRLTKLKQQAGVLVNTTDHMLQALEGKGDSLRALQDEILQKSTKLEGLEAKLQDLLAKLRKKAHDLSACQG